MFKILDCTLRDGGYHNLWDFPINIVNEYLDAMSKSNVDIVEIGFRSLDTTEYKGPLAFSSENYINSLVIPTNIEIAVMVNASEFLNSSLSFEKCIDILFPNTSSVSFVKLVRIACHIKEFEKVLKISKLLNQKGYKVAYNIMQFSEITINEIENFCNKAKDFPIDILYFADSLGSLNPSEVSKILDIVKRNWEKPIGIHTHNNLGLALLNSITAIKKNVEFIDSTVTGMGRGPGNAKTEELLFEAQALRKSNFDLISLSNLISNFFKPLQKKLEWGDNYFYYLAGKKKIHPTYIQEILKNPSFSNNDILAYINYLGKINAKSYKFNKLEDVLESFFDYKYINNSHVNFPKKTKILIIGKGESILKFKYQIEDLIEKNNLFVICLNINEDIKNDLVDLRVACHPIRIISDIGKYKDLKSTITMPKSMLKSTNENNFTGLEINDYSIKLEKDSLIAEENIGVVPNFNVLGYALTISLKMESKEIYLVGFDGFEINDPRHIEVQNIIDIFSRDYPEKDLFSITPSSYRLKQKSIHAFG